MKLFKKIRKGFTLIELVVVIAVIAILSAVSVVSYVAITNRAKQSNDQQKVDQVNLSVQAAEISGRPATMHEALEAVEADGFSVEKFKAEAKNYEFGYSMSENRFIILEGEKVVYPKEMTKLSKGADIWRFTSSKENLKDGFSYYLLEDVSGEVEVAAGCDVGKNDDISKITYSSAATQDVVFRTNGGELSVDGVNSHVEHHNLLNKAVISKVSSTTYVEHGAVAVLEISADVPSVVLEKTAFVVELKNENTNLEVTNKGYVTKSSGAGASKVTPSSGAIKVVDLPQLQSLALSSSQQGFDFSNLVIELQNDIDMSGHQWIPFGYSKENPFSGRIDGKGHKISGMGSTDVTKLPVWTTSSGEAGFTYGLIAHGHKDIEISHLSIDIQFSDSNAVGASAFLGAYNNHDKDGATVTLKDLKASGSISAKDKAGGFVGTTYVTAEQFGVTSHNYKVTFVLDNCISSVDVSAKRAGGLIGTAAARTGTSLIQLKNSCKAKGTIVGTSGTGSESAAYGEAIGVLAGGNGGYKYDLSGFVSSSLLADVGFTNPGAIVYSA